jgi:U3 small nucleolar RNA-associated protein 18
MNGTARAVAFTSDSNELLTSGSDGDVYRWDLRMNHRCVERFANQDGTITSSLAASSRTVAVGAESGVVNLYAERDEQPQQPRQRNSGVVSLARIPFKSIMNLKTAADQVTFNNDGQILAVSSRRGRDSLRLVHVPTGTVFANWPTSKTPLGYVWCTAFGPSSKFLAVGNDRGKCLLYKLMHYEQNDDVD